MERENKGREAEATPIFLRKERLFSLFEDSVIDGHKTMNTYRKYNTVNISREKSLYLAPALKNISWRNINTMFRSLSKQ